MYRTIAKCSLDLKCHVQNILNLALNYRDDHPWYVYGSGAFLAGLGYLVYRQKRLTKKWQTACRMMPGYATRKNLTEADKLKNADRHEYPRVILLRDSFLIFGLAKNLDEITANLQALEKALEYRKLAAVEEYGMGYRIYFK